MNTKPICTKPMLTLACLQIISWDYGSEIQDIMHMQLEKQKDHYQILLTNLGNVFIHNPKLTNFNIMIKKFSSYGI